MAEPLEEVLQDSTDFGVEMRFMFLLGRKPIALAHLSDPNLV